MDVVYEELARLNNRRCFQQWRVSGSVFFASESEWTKTRVDTFEGSEWVLSFHVCILDASLQLV